MKRVRYTKFTGDLSSSFGLEDLMQALSDFLLDSGFNDPYSQFQEMNDQTLENLRVARMQVDAAIMFERITNTLKLLGDQYLARVYQLASQQFRLPEWNSTILHKLGTVDSIYQKLNDRAEAKRMEVLEWVIIILIAVSMLLPFLTGVAGH